MNTYVRMTKITDVVGRADYISNSERQENIVVMSEILDWKPYREYERKSRKGMCENNEARELIIALPNEWSKLENIQLRNRVQKLAEICIGKKTDLQWAVHWNKTHTNMHVHLLFSERKLLSENLQFKFYDRDIYLTNDGKVARNKKDRATDEKGRVKPPVHYKGEKKGIFLEFSVKDVKYKAKNWLETVKTDVKKYFKANGVAIDDNGLFHQYHEGKGNESPIIREKNKRIKEINALIELLKQNGGSVPQPNTPEYAELYKILREHFKNGKPIPLPNIFQNQELIQQNSHKNQNITLEPINNPSETEKNVNSKQKPALPINKIPQNVNVELVNNAAFSSSPADEILTSQKSTSVAEPFNPNTVISKRNELAELILLFYYKETNTVDTTIQDRINTLKEIIVNFPAIAKQINQYNEELSKCNIFQKAKKRELQEKIDNLAFNLEIKGKTIEKERGVVNFYFGEALNYANPQNFLVEFLINDIKKKILPNLEAVNKTEIEKAEFLEKIRHIDFKRYTPLFRDFSQSLENIPVECAESVYNALQTAYTPKFNIRMQIVFDVHRELKEIIEKSNLQKQINLIEKTKREEQSKNMDYRKGYGRNGRSR